MFGLVMRLQTGKVFTMYEWIKALHVIVRSAERVTVAERYLGQFCR
jgi:hypothetical protein